MSQPQEMDGRKFTKTLAMLLLAFTIVFGAGFIFVRATKAIQDARGIEGGSASLNESNDAAEETAIVPAPPKDIPMYKGGSLASARDGSSMWAYEIMFPLGSLEEIRNFYDAEMAKLGWQKFAGGSKVSVFMKENPNRKASLNFSYYGGKVRLRVLTSK